MRWTFLLLLSFFVVGFPALAFSPSWSSATYCLVAGERVIVVLKDGSEVIGEVVEENAQRISVSSVFGVTSIEMDRVESIIRGEEVDRREFDQRQKRALRRGSAAGWYSLGVWAQERGLADKARSSFESALDIDPEHEPSKIALGWGKVEGEWKNPEEIAALLDKGWRRDGANLLPPRAGTPVGPKKPEPKKPEATSPKPDSTRPGRISTPESVLGKLSPKEQKRRETELERRRQERLKFEQGKRREYEGVPWPRRSIIKSRNWQIECNSTPEVARTYQWIMEALSSTLGKIFKAPDVRRQKPVVKIYRNHDEFMLKTGMGGGVGGFYQPDSQNVVAYHGTFGLTGTTYTVLAHEGTHAFQGKKLARMTNYPNWFIEGMAVYFGDGSKLDYKKKRVVTGLIPRDRLFHIQEKIAEGRHTQLSKLGGLPRNRFSGTHYADSWAVMHYLINGPESKKGQRFLVDYWKLGEKRRVGQRQFNNLAERYFGDVDQMEADWQKYVLSLKPDPAGEIDGDHFVSMDFMFSISRPDEKWEYVLDEIQDRDLVLMRIPETRNEIRVRILTKSEDSQRPQDWIDSELLPALRKKYRDVRSFSGDLGGLDAYVFEFYDRPPEPEKKEEEQDGSADGEQGAGAGDTKSFLQKLTMAAQQEPPDPDDGEKGTAEEAPKLLKHRSYVLVGVSNAYELRGSFEQTQFNELLGDLEWVAFSFEKIQKNRW
ncbi:MAG TPA: DUF1570 domain-containing protein [Planctomycetes bacterium]|nr:DUF1570 domain-containing protein [Planctomycetota bacterium]